MGYHMVDREKVCVILGAGASFDVKDEGTSWDQNNYKPPLASGLFDTNKREFYEILNHYEGARFLANLLPRELAQGKGFEEALAYFAYHVDEPLKAHFAHDPPYLRDLLRACSDKYIPDPTCYIYLVTEFLAEHHFFEVLFLVLNYDDLLEKALNSYDSTTYSFKAMDDYVQPERNAKVVKLHGSINWFREFEIPSGIGWLDAVKKPTVRKRPLDSEIVVIDDHTGPRIRHDKCYDMQSGRNGYYPILTAPLAGKQADDSVCPTSHTSFAKEFLRSCRRFLVIGSSGSDADLLALLQKSMKPESQPLIHFVGSGREAKASLERFQKEVEAFRSRATVTFSGGFRVYVNEDLRAFVNAELFPT